MGSSYAAGEIMCPETSSRVRRGGKKAAAAEQKANKQPQRGLGVAQLEKIRLHNQMMAAYRSGMHHPDARAMQQQAPSFTAPSAETTPSYSYHTPVGATDRGMVGVQYYGGNLQPYSSSGHQRQPGQQGPPQQHCWLMTTSDGNAEELDLELRL